MQHDKDLDTFILCVPTKGVQARREISRVAPSRRGSSGTTPKKEAANVNFGFTASPRDVASRTSSGAGLLPLQEQLPQ